MRLGLAILALLVAAPVVHAQSVAGDHLGGSGDQHIVYPSYNSSGFGAPAMRVAAVGDVNGDGREDVGVGFVYAEDEDDAYITFSSPAPASGAVGDLPGFHIRTKGLLGLAGIGDVNGDGLGDIALTHWSGGLVVVFGKTDGAEVDTAKLGAGGFRVTEVGQAVGEPDGVIGVGDLNGDSVPDLAAVDYELPEMENGNWVLEPEEVVVIHPPRDSAGLTIDGEHPGPHISRIGWGDTIGVPHIGALGDVDGDGRQDLLIGGDERDGSDHVAYGTRIPAPGSFLDVRSAVDKGAAFELRTHDGGPNARGHLEDAVTLTDQNGDGRRDVGMVGARIEDGHRIVRIAYSPAFGTRTDIHDLRSDWRGFTVRLFGNALDIGDQDGDGRGDVADRHTVRFTDPAREEEPDEWFGFWFNARPELPQISAAIDDLNGDGKPEIALARVDVERNGPDGVWLGERATYELDVFDSARSPAVSAPAAPVAAGDDELEFAAEVDAGAGRRGATTLAMQPAIEVRTVAGESVYESGLEVTAARSRVSHRLPARLFSPDAIYRYRFRLGNGRGLNATGPWREFSWPPRVEEATTPATPATTTSSPATTTEATGTTAPAEDMPPKTIAAAEGVVRRGTLRRERLVGTRHDDRLYGLSGDDVLLGEAGRDMLFGGRGRDLVVGGPDSDLIEGGEGDDRIDARDGMRDVVDCGRGRDRVRADHADVLKRCERRRLG